MLFEIPTGPVYRVPGKKVMWTRTDDAGPMVSWDGGEMWHFTYRGLEEFRQMWPTLELVENPSQLLEIK